MDNYFKIIKFEPDVKLLKVIAFISILSLSFQFFIPINNSKILFNLCDPIALISFFIFIRNILFKKEFPIWEINNFNRFLALFFLIFLFSFLKGLFDFGYTDWAFFNKLCGSLLIIGYLNIGYLYKKKFGNKFALYLLFIMLITNCFVVLINLFLRLDLLSILPVTYDSYNFQGFVSNRNTFAFQLLCALILLIGFIFNKQNIPNLFLNKILNKNIFIHFLGGIIIYGIYLTGSKTSYISLFFIFISSLILRIIKFQFLFKLILYAFFINLVNLLFNDILVGIYTISEITFNNILDYFNKSFYFENNFSFKFPTLIFRNNFERDYLLQGSFVMKNDNTILRFETIKIGLDLFKKHFLFGTGLGYFRNNSFDLIREKSLTIHSTPIWILAEFGIISFIIFVNQIKNILLFSIYKFRVFEYSVFLILLIINFIVFGLAHDILFQRVFWMILGLCLSSDSFFKNKIANKY